MSTNNEIRLQQQLDEAHLLLFSLNQELQALREQKPVAFTDNEGMLWLPKHDSNVSSKVRSPLYAAPMPAREGWQLVPLDPTDEMIDAGCEIATAYRVDMMKAWKAMLEAAPKEPS